ncbi:EAL domain-containing protein [Vibrio sp. 99-8-1]|uniref:bifunctional diguanylate cyclase/phosphodiesterase n=1 Tax=Vibrio sp. 99-8-1 TaxID=2607602 RepID=UPI0014938672|nr:EAL domain-containing protein [Vibrio sp. 99-8-1]NOI67921.1 EAL domain-containing protein [Vibrio sp. 99-8-1]
MATLKKNIWMLFWIIITISIILFSYYGYFLWKSNEDRFKQFQYTQVHLFSDSVEAFLKSQESLLQVLGNQLAIDNALPSSAIHSATLDRVRKTHPFFAGLGLANIDGDLVVTSSNLNIAKLPNLLQQEVSRKSFLQVIQSQKMIAGRTYQLKALNDNSLAIAVRKAIYTDSGSVAAVMTAGIKVSESVLFNDKQHVTENYNELDIIRDDGYFQFYSGNLAGNKNYQTPLQPSLLTGLIESVLAYNNIDLQTLKSAKSPYFTRYKFAGIAKHITLEYDPYFNFWVVSSTNSDYIEAQFHTRFFTSFLVSIIFALMFYFLVRSIARSEEDKLSQLLYQTRHDFLTDLPNHGYLTYLFEDNRISPCSMIFVNIDRFKNVNDSYGHDFGDKVIMDVALRLKQFSNKPNTLIRGIGDEFIVLSDELEEAALRKLCQNIQTSLSQPYSIGDISFLLTVSISTANYPMHGTRFDELLRSLDIAMLQAKKNKNTIYCYSPKLQAEHLASLHLEQKLRQAIKNRELYMAYQPQVTGDGSLYGVEALVRWVDKDVGYVPPDKFISIAEQSGLMSSLGDLIIEMSVKEMAMIQQQTEESFRLSINISVKQFLQKEFSSLLFGALDKYGFSPDQVTVEITENLFIEDIGTVKPVCEELISKGVLISLDDFGTGYSSLSILRNLPIKELKIDKSFVDDIDVNNKSHTMIHNIISIGKNYRMKVLAEGVETESQKQMLAESGCDLFQGYLYAKPLSVKELLIYVKPDN